MKKTIILFSLCLITVAAFCSFKYLESSNESHTAIVTQMNGRGDNQGFIITYGDGNIEKVKFDIKILSQDNMIDLQSTTAKIMEQLYAKGYHFQGSYTSNLQYMVFEKR